MLLLPLRVQAWKDSVFPQFCSGGYVKEDVSSEQQTSSGCIKQRYSQLEAPADAGELKVPGSSFIPSYLPFPSHVSSHLHQHSSHPWWGRAESDGSCFCWMSKGGKNIADEN